MTENLDFLNNFTAFTKRVKTSELYMGIRCKFIRDFTDDFLNYTQYIFHKGDLLLKEVFLSGVSHKLEKNYLTTYSNGMLNRLWTEGNYGGTMYFYQDYQGTPMIVKIKHHNYNRPQAYLVEYFSETYQFKVSKRKFYQDGQKIKEEHYYQSGNIKEIVDYIGRMFIYYWDEASSFPSSWELFQDDSEEEYVDYQQLSVNDVLHQNPDFSGFDKCSICFTDKEDIQEPIALNCNNKHIFCKNCLNNHIQFQINQQVDPSCPLCRQVIQFVQH